MATVASSDSNDRQGDSSPRRRSHRRRRSHLLVHGVNRHDNFSYAGDIDLSLSAALAANCSPDQPVRGLSSNGTVSPFKAMASQLCTSPLVPVTTAPNGLQARAAQYQSNGFGIVARRVANFGAAGVARVLSGWLDVQVRALVIDGQAHHRRR